MGEISNKTIVVLLAVTLVVTVAGTMYSVSKLGTLNINYNKITGADTSTGTADINITSSISFTVSDSTIDFGSMVWNTSCNSSDAAYKAANLSTNGTAAAPNSHCLVNSTEDPADENLTSKVSVDDGHVIENDGTTGINITVQLTNVTSDALSDVNISANGFVCGDKDGCPESGALFPSIWVSALDSVANDGACVDTTGASFDWSDMSGALLVQNEGPTSEILLCANLAPADGGDEIDIEYQLQIPYDVYGGDRQATLTYTATSI